MNRASSDDFQPGLLPSGIPVVVISLADQNTRREKLIAHGIPSAWVKDYFPAIDLRGADPDTLHSCADVAEMANFIGRPVRPGEIGCAMSHRAVSGWLASSPFPMALILEDDVVPLDEEWLARVDATTAALLPHARNGAAFICNFGVPQPYFNLVLKRRIAWRSGPPSARTPELFLHTDPGPGLWRAHAYLISCAAAGRWGSVRKIQALADDWNEMRRRGWIDEIFFANPPLFGQDRSQLSTIRPTNDEDLGPPPRNRPFLTRVARSLLAGNFVERARSSVIFRCSRIIYIIQSHFTYYLRY